MQENRQTEIQFDETIQDLIRGITVIMEATDTPFYLFHNEERRLLHISSAFSDLVDISYADFKSGKITDFGHLVHEKDRELMTEILIKSEELLSDYRLSGQALSHMVFSTNFRIMTDSGYIFIDVNSFPIFHSKDSLPLVSANVVRSSHKKGFDRLTFYAFGRNIRLVYSQKQKKFVAEHKMHLKHVELEILRLSSEGLIEKQICDKLKVKPSLVNYHKREIFNKLNVASIQEAVYVALLSGLI